MSYPKGVDVSAYQSSYSTDGLSFVFIKATEGHTYTSPVQGKQADQARAAGCVVGFYHFLWPGNIQEQAEYFVEKCDSVPGDLLVVDWETTGEGTHASCAEKDAFIAAVKKLRPGHKVGLYCNTDFWLHKDVTSDCGDFLWIADPNHPAGSPGIQHPWTFHQYSWAGGIDRDVANFASADAFKEWVLGGSAAKPAPKPATKPKVSLAHVVAAAKKDPKAPQGHATYKADVLLVEKALVAEGYLAKKWADGSFGTMTIAAYAKWQRHLGYSGKAADGIPGKTSLTKLGARHGFQVV